MAQTLEQVAETIWDTVCHNIDIVLKQCELHGLLGILKVKDPAVEGRLSALKNFEEICNAIISLLEGKGPEQYDTVRTMYNAKQQILNLGLLLNAAKNSNKIEFDKANELLKNQAKI